MPGLQATSRAPQSRRRPLSLRAGARSLSTDARPLTSRPPPLGTCRHTQGQQVRLLCLLLVEHAAQHSFDWCAGPAESVAGPLHRTVSADGPQVRASLRAWEYAASGAVLQPACKCTTTPAPVQLKICSQAASLACLQPDLPLTPMLSLTHCVVAGDPHTALLQVLGSHRMLRGAPMQLTLVQSGRGPVESLPRGALLPVHSAAAVLPHLSHTLALSFCAECTVAQHFQIGLVCRLFCWLLGTPIQPRARYQREAGAGRCEYQPALLLCSVQWRPCCTVPAAWADHTVWQRAVGILRLSTVTHCRGEQQRAAARHAAGGAAEGRQPCSNQAQEANHSQHDGLCCQEAGANVCCRIMCCMDKQARMATASNPHHEQHDRDRILGAG